MNSHASNYTSGLSLGLINCTGTWIKSLSLAVLVHGSINHDWKLDQNVTFILALSHMPSGSGLPWPAANKGLQVHSSTCNDQLAVFKRPKRKPCFDGNLTGQCVRPGYPLFS